MPEGEKTTPDWKISTQYRMYDFGLVDVQKKMICLKTRVPIPTNDTFLQKAEIVVEGDSSVVLLHRNDWVPCG